MDKHNFTIQKCLEHLKTINNIQTFIASESCPGKLLPELLEHQLDLIEDLNTKLMLCEELFFNKKAPN